MAARDLAADGVDSAKTFTACDMKSTRHGNRIAYHYAMKRFDVPAARTKAILQRYTGEASRSCT